MNNKQCVMERTVEGVSIVNRHPSEGADVQAALAALELRKSSSKPREFSRAEILKKGLILGGATALGGALATDALATRTTAYRRSVSLDTSTVRLACAGPVLSLDPDNAASNTYVPSIQAINACYDSLTSFAMYTTIAAANLASRGIGLQPKPQLASSWKTSPDGKTVVFNLRKGVKSSFGNELKAQNVIWSLSKVLALGRAGKTHLNANGITDPSQIVATDDYTVQFNSTGQFRLLLTMGYFFFPIYDIVEVQKHTSSSDPWAQTWLNTNTAGFGPYVISDFGGGNTVKFTARGDYWGPKPTPNVIYQNVGDPSARLQLLLAGQVDYAEGLAPLQLKQVAKNPKTQVASLLSTKGVQLSLTYQSAPWNDPKVRQAIAKAMPYQSIVKLAYQNLPPAQQAKSILTPFIQTWTDKFGIKPDPVAAKAGLSSVAGANLELAYDVNGAIDELCAVLIQSALRQVGITVTFKALPHPLFLQLDRTVGTSLPNQVNTADAPAFPITPYYYEQTLLYPAIENFSQYNNPQAISLTQQNSALWIAGQGTSPQAKALSVQLQQIYMRDLPTIPLVWGGDTRGLAKGLQILQAQGGTTQIYWQNLKWGKAS
jgi:peptide/nickel transport system substrate-binding protein